MKTGIRALAFDIGAGSGRALTGLFNADTLAIQEVRRFANRPALLNGSLYWDILSIYNELLESMIRCALSDNPADSIGISAWGVDFGLLSRNGELLSNPYHYRDRRNDTMMAKVFETVPRQRLFRATGVHFAKYNSIYQLAAYRTCRPELLEQAHALLLIPDLLNYFMTGAQSTEHTVASTTQLLQAGKPAWALDIIRKLTLPERLFTPVHRPGVRVGELSAAVREQTGLGRTPVAAVASHDSASAVVAIPARAEKFAFISCGTWSIVGTETGQPILSDKVFNGNFTNEQGFGDKIRLLKNIGGLWMIQELKRCWEERAGLPVRYEELDREAQAAQPFRHSLDPDHDSFMSPGNMPHKIDAYCRSTGQPVPQTRGQYIRCVLESLAFKYKQTIRMLEDILEEPLPVVHLVGGGCRNELLCRFTASATGKPVVAGPVEATTIGNLLVQLHASGEVEGLAQMRDIVRGSFPTRHYQPEEGQAWNEAYGDYLARVGCRDLQNLNGKP